MFCEGFHCYVCIFIFPTSCRPGTSPSQDRWTVRTRVLPVEPGQVPIPTTRGVRVTDPGLHDCAYPTYKKMVVDPFPKMHHLPYGRKAQTGDTNTYRLVENAHCHVGKPSVAGKPPFHPGGETIDVRDCIIQRARPAKYEGGTSYLCCWGHEGRAAVWERCGRAVRLRWGESTSRTQNYFVLWSQTT